MSIAKQGFNLEELKGKKSKRKVFENTDQKNLLALPLELQDCDERESLHERANSIRSGKLLNPQRN